MLTQATVSPALTLIADGEKPKSTILSCAVDGCPGPLAGGGGALPAPDGGGAGAGGGAEPDASGTVIVPFMSGWKSQW